MTAPQRVRRDISATAAGLLSLQRLAGNQAVNNVIQRQIIRNPPKYVSWPKDLAAGVLEQAPFVGLTTPYLNDQPFKAKSPPPDVDLGEFTTVDTKGSYQPVHPEMEQVYDAFDNPVYEDLMDPRDVTAAEEWDEDRYIGWASREPVNRFDWTVELPPPGPWVQQNVAKDKLVQVVKWIEAKSKVDVPDAENLLTSETGTLEVTDPQGHQALSNHTKAHENQHVGDHRGLIDEMFGPWDNLIGQHNSQAKGLKSSSKSAPESVLRNGRGFTPAGAGRIAFEFYPQMVQSGDEFHDTDEGSVPVITVPSVTEDKVTVHVTPKIRLALGAIPPARYVWGQDKVGG